VLKEFLVMDVTAVQVDIMRTFLINNSKIGVGYSASRFTQYLLNMGQRRKPEHSYLCKTVTGGRADVDSEDWDNDSAEEELIKIGDSEEVRLENASVHSEDADASLLRHLNDDYIEEDFEEPSGLSSKAASIVEEWCDEVIEDLAGRDQDRQLVTQSVELVDLFAFGEDDDSEQSDDENQGESLAESMLGNVTTNSPVRDHQNGSAPAFDFGDAMDFMDNVNIDDVFDPEDSDSFYAKEGNGDGGLDELFSKALNKTYERIEDQKDAVLASERTGHTVSGNLENTRMVVTYLKDWIDRVGSTMEQDQRGILSKNVSTITGLYSMMDSLGLLDSVNLLEKFYHLDNMVLPVDLSALAVVDTIYG
jgi:hypothetical protein